MPKNSVSVGGNVSGGVVTAGDRNIIKRASPAGHKVSVELQDSHGNVVVAGGGGAQTGGGVRNQASASISQAVSLAEMRDRITGLRRILQEIDVPAGIKQEVDAEFDTGLAQLRKREPDAGLIKAALQNAARAIGAMGTTETVHQLIQGVTAMISKL